MRETEESSRLRNYIHALAQLRLDDTSPLVSIILFGSAASDAFSAQISDVDLIIVLPDGSTSEERRRIREVVSELEITHGFRLPASRAKNKLERFAEHAGGNACACFICTRGDLLSGDAARVFGLRPAEKFFVDRIVLASVIVSAVTVWGEELLPRISLPALRRLDVFKAFFNLSSMIFLSAAAFPVLPDATRYAMGALKHSLHSCHFCYRLKTASVSEEVDFFNSLLGKSTTLLDLLEQRRNYHPSFRFVLRCAPLLCRLHLRTMRDNRFPRAVVRPDA